MLDIAFVIRYCVSMKLSDWARKTGISYITAYRWFRAGGLPVPAIQTKTGTILVQEQDTSKGEAAVYARVSCSEQKQDLDRQVSRLVSWASENNVPVSRVVKEIGSGMNGRRRKLLSLLNDAKVTTIIVEHSDRLARFGVEHLRAALGASGRQIIILDEGEVSDDLVKDMFDILTSMCARLYGKRSAKNRAKRAMEAAGEGS